MKCIMYRTHARAEEEPSRRVRAFRQAFDTISAVLGHLASGAITLMLNMSSAVCLSIRGTSGTLFGHPRRGVLGRPHVICQLGWTPSGWINSSFDVSPGWGRRRRSRAQNVLCVSGPKVACAFSNASPAAVAVSVRPRVGRREHRPPAANRHRYPELAFLLVTLALRRREWNSQARLGGSLPICSGSAYVPRENQWLSADHPWKVFSKRPAHIESDRGLSAPRGVLDPMG